MSVVIPQQRLLKIHRGTTDRIFRTVITAGAMFSLSILALIAFYLFTRGLPIFRDFGFKFLTSSEWSAGSDDGTQKASFGVAAMLLGSMIIATIALLVSLPFAMGVSLYLEHYSPKAIRGFLISILDLAASIPSVIWGIWGYTIFNPMAQGWARSLNHWLSWIPLFAVQTPIFERSPFIAGILLAMMILPITTSVTREVYGLAPRDQIDAVYGLGGTRWGAMKTVVLPFGRSGLLGGAMLGLGRALGETVAVYLVLNLFFKVNLQILLSAGGNVASLIATRFGEAGPYELKALIAAGFVLFVLTLVVNFLASLIINRGKSIQ